MSNVRTDFRKRRTVLDSRTGLDGWTILIDDEDLAPLTEFFNERHAKLEKLQQAAWDTKQVWLAAMEAARIAGVAETDAWIAMHDAEIALQTELDARATRQAAQVAA